MAIDPKDLLALLTATAPGLRQAGICELSFDGVHVKYTPWEPEPAQQDDEEPENYADPLEDPALYGGQVPGFKLRGKK